MLSLLALADACAVALAWCLSYWIRFNWLPVDPAKGVPDFAGRYLSMLPVVVAAHLIIFLFVRLYRPRRDQSVLSESREIIKAFLVAVVAIILIDYALPASNKISRPFLVTYAVLGTTCLVLLRGSVRLALHEARRRGWNQRSTAIVGTGRAAQQLHYLLGRHRWMGYHVEYFVDDRQRGDAAEIRGVPVHGPLSRLRPIMESQPVDAVFIALPAAQSERTDEMLDALSTSMADVRVVPAINPAYMLRPAVSDLDGLPIVSLRQTPLMGWNAVLKRLFDIVVGGICLMVAAVPMLIIAVAVKLSSPGPVFYRQRRTGLDGHEFTLLKFRTMRTDAEDGTGAVWARPDDPRRTPIGRFLRRTSLDELPQLFNVLSGQMSLVGPRPERPEFIAQFKTEVPRYMLRHKMKAGMTGFAQIKGYRGNTSLRKRIQHDVHYINHWSLGLDVRILARTVTSTWFSRHES